MHYRHTPEQAPSWCCIQALLIGRALDTDVAPESRTNLNRPEGQPAAQPSAQPRAPPLPSTRSRDERDVAQPSAQPRALPLPATRSRDGRDVAQPSAQTRAPPLAVTLPATRSWDERGAQHLSTQRCSNPGRTERVAPAALGSGMLAAAPELQWPPGEWLLRPPSADLEVQA